MWMALIPFAAFAGAFSVGAIGLWFLARQTKISQTETSTGPSTHVDSPLGTLDSHSEARLDPRLAVLPRYPGAMPENPRGPQSVTETYFAHRSLRDITAAYWTDDPVSQVWDFYRQQLPDWPRNLSETQGKELLLAKPDHVCLIRISRRADGRTRIEASIKPAGYPNVF